MFVYLAPNVETFRSMHTYLLAAKAYFARNLRKAPAAEVQNDYPTLIEVHRHALLVSPAQRLCFKMATRRGLTSPHVLEEKMARSGHKLTIGKAHLWRLSRAPAFMCMVCNGLNVDNCNAVRCSAASGTEPPPLSVIEQQILLRRADTVSEQSLLLNRLRIARPAL